MPTESLDCDGAIELFSNILPARALHYVCEQGPISFDRAVLSGVNDQTVKEILEEKGIRVFQVVRRAVHAILQSKEFSQDHTGVYELVDIALREEKNPLVQAVREILEDRCGQVF